MSAADYGPNPHELVALLSHPRRRRIMQLFVGRDEPLSSVEASQVLDDYVHRLGYHFRCLAKGGAIELVKEVPSRGTTRYYYLPAPGVLELDLVRTILESTDDV